MRVGTILYSFVGGQVKWRWKALLFLLLLSCLALADSDSIDYRVDTSELKNHRLRVEADFPADFFQTEKRELALAVWTPGSYKVRDYSRFLSRVELKNPGASIRKTAKNRWLIEGLKPTETVRISYTVYGHELTVRTNYFTPELSLIVGAATFLAPAPLHSDLLKKRPYRVSFDDRAPVLSTSLERIGPKLFRARDYDELVDGPIVMGDITRHPFMAGGVDHELVQAGDTQYWDLAKSLEDVKTLTETIQDFWGDVPYERYIFQNLVTDTRGGLEHRNSTVVMTSRFATEDRKKYVGWLSLLSHEYFHTWNVKRLRPVTLGPFDYEKEVYTRSLWIAEGITSYYDDLLVRRAGLSTREEYLKALSKQLNRLLTTPGRQQITLADASFDAWIRLYQPTDDLHNSNISYYNKGAIVAWLLDTELRKRTQGEIDLDHVLGKAYQKFQGRGFEEAEFRALVSELSKSDFSTFFEATLDSTQPLPLQPALEYWGLEWKPKTDDEVPYLGVEVGNRDSRVVIDKVLAGSPAARAGIAPGDELIAIGDYRVPDTDSLANLKYLKTETSYSILTSRLGKLQRRDVVFSKAPHRESALHFKSEPTPEQSARWRSWLGPERKSEV